MPDYDTVFIHIPKTGGTSIRKGVFEGNYVGPEFVMPTEWRRSFSFAFVRNPFDRLVSSWKMFTSGTSERPPSIHHRMNISEFLDVVSDESISFELGDAYDWAEHVRHHSLPQTHDYYYLEAAQYVGRFEAIGRDWQYLCTKLSIDYQNLPKRHYTKRGHYSNYFDSNSREKAEFYYRDDLKILGYVF